MAQLFFQDQTVYCNCFFMVHCEWLPGLNVRVVFELLFSTFVCQLFFRRVVFQLFFIAVVSLFITVVFVICFSGLESALQLFFIFHCKWLSGLNVRVMFQLLFSTVVFQFVFQQSCFSIVFRCSCFMVHYSYCSICFFQDQTVHCGCFSLFTTNGCQD